LQHGYLNYLKESLEVEDFILPFRPVVDHLAFYIQSADKSLSAQANELLRKMTKAMGRDLAITPVTMLAAGNPFVEGAATVKVLFTSDVNSPSVGTWNDGIMTTYSPELLLQKPELKKPTWAHLQAVMMELEK
jgi:hypothetical protein